MRLLKNRTLSTIKSIFRSFWQRFVLPNSKEKDRARREYILNILLVGLIILATAAFCVNLVYSIFYGASYRGSTPILTGFIVLFLFFLLALSRKNRSYLSSFITIFFFFSLSMYTNYQWGADLPQALLLYCLVIVMSGILISSRFAFLITILSGLSIFIFSYLEIHALTKPDYAWKSEIITSGSAVVYFITLGIIAIVSWLSNREMEKALKRARTSETALKRQRDNLELLVEKRTQELKLAQTEKLMQLYRFAEFGRLASGLFHDLVNPLNLVSLNLDRLQKHNKKLDHEKISATQNMLNRAITGTQRIDSFIKAARKQMQDQTITQTFSLKHETNQALQILAYKAKKAEVKLLLSTTSDIKFYGNPFKFNQFMTNLISNAIDAYDEISDRTKIVEIRFHEKGNKVHLEIQDWGSGISQQDLLNIFEPLFTTKSPQKGMGLGLSICKDIIEKDFNGKIHIQSEKNVGTTFIITFPIQKAPKGRIKRPKKI